MDGVMERWNEAFAAGLAIAAIDETCGEDCFRFGYEGFRLPHGAVRMAVWNGLLVSLIGDVREAAARAG